MNLPTIHISREDLSKLRLLLAAIPAGAGSPLTKLRAELDRAVVIDSDLFPPDIVALDSLVEYEDLATGEVESYTLTLPEQADIKHKRLSILAPIGTALIGCRVGDIVDWSTPGGIRRLRLRRVVAGAHARRH